MNSKSNFQELAERYTELYDLAPSGYFTLSREGEILNLNLCGAQMLGKERSQITDSRFDLFLSKETKPLFHLFLELVFSAKGKEACEIELLSNGDIPMFVLLTGNISGNSEQCYVTAVDITERRQGEAARKKIKEALELTKQSYLDIINTVSEAIYILDEAGTFIDVNRGAEKMYLFEKQDLVGKTPADVSAPGLNDLEKIGARMQSVFKTGITDVFEFWGIRKNGEIFPKEVIVNKGRYFGKEVLIATARDISERKQADALFRDIIEKNPISIQILNMDGYTIQTNSAHTKLFGVRTPADYSIFKDAQLLKQGLGQLFDQIKQGKVVYFPDSHFNVHDVDPSFPDVMAWIKAVGFTLHGENGIPDRIVLMHENITERKHAEAMFHDIVDKNPMSIQIIDKEGYTVGVNPAFTRLFGSLPPPGFSIFTDLQRKSPELEKIILHAKTGEVVHLPDLYYNPHDVSPDLPDNPLWIRAIIFPLKDVLGKPERFVLMHENISERKEAENKIRSLNETLEQRIAERTQQLETVNKELTFHLSELEQFSYVSNHDLQEPLRSLIQFTHLIKENYAGKLDEDGNKYIDFISKSAHRMSVLVRDLLDYSLLGKERIQSVINCNKIVDAVLFDLDDSIKKSKARITVQELPTINGCETELRLLFQNLLENSIKYKKKEVVSEIYISAEKFEKEWHFSIKDNGIGIDKKHREKIFIIFQRLHNRSEYDGTGIGLAHCKKIVEMHGGKIWVESSPGAGSTFTFSIPME